MMKEQINILILEDSIDDVELILMILERAAISNKNSVASNREEFLFAIENDTFDLIISDLNLGQFNCFEAMNLTEKTGIPFIVASGMIPPETLAELKERNIPYLFKDNLKELPKLLAQVFEKK
jgi:diguanylate cyclase